MEQVMMKSKSQVVYNYIERKIMLGQYKAGEKIPSEKKLCDQLGVSRVSVRSGIEKLIAIGLLTKKKHGSTYVASNDQDNFLQMMSPAFVHNFNYLEMLEIRRALDVLTVELCLENLDPEAVKKLESLVAEMKNFKEEDDFFELDRNFHLTISRCSHNRLLHSINEVIWDVLEKARRDQYHSIGNEERILEHGKILDAMIHSDLDLAKIFSLRHIERTIRAIAQR